MKTWNRSNPLPFQVGRVAQETPANQWATQVESLPWLILIDAKGIVLDEGFSLDELEAKVAALEALTPELRFR